MLKVTNYKPLKSGALVGVFSLKIEKWGNFIIEDMRHFRKSSHQWINFPNRSYEDSNGEKKYFHYNKFEDLETMKMFSQKVIPAIENYLNEHPEILQESNQKIEPFEIPNGKIPF
jgi:hypothetical protein